MMNELSEYKAKKQGKVTPTELAKNLYEACKRGEVKDLVFVTTDDKGEASVGWSEGNYYKFAGMMEAGKITLLDDIYE